MSILCPYLTALSNKEYIGQSLDIRLSKVCPDFVHPYLLNANSKSNVHTLSNLCPCPKFVQTKMCWTKVCPSYVHTLSRQNCHHRLKVKHPYFVQCLSMSNVCPHFVQAPLNSCPLFVLIHTVCPNYANPKAISPIWTWAPGKSWHFQFRLSTAVPQAQGSGVTICTSLTSGKLPVWQAALFVCLVRYNLIG